MSWHPHEDSIAIAATNNVSFHHSKAMLDKLLTISSFSSSLPCKRGLSRVRLFGDFGVIASRRRRWQLRWFYGVFGAWVGTLAA
jgi:hypothetical protein